jgi:hypothetical protein
VKGGTSSGCGIRWRSEPPIKFLFVSHCSRFTRLDLRSSNLEMEIKTKKQNNKGGGDRAKCGISRGKK